MGLLSTSIWKLRADKAVKLAILSRYVFPGITVCTKGEHSGFDVSQTSVLKLGDLEQLNLPFPLIRSDCEKQICTKNELNSWTIEERKKKKGW